MPQAHRKDDMGQNSRLMAAGKFSENTLRSVNVINGLESKLASVKLHVLERNAIYSLQKIKNDETHIQDLRQKTLAYQKVVEKHPIATAPDYQKALDDKYTLYSFRHEIKDMLFALHPDTIRKKRTQALMEASRVRYQAAIHSSQQYFNSLLSLKPNLAFDKKHKFKPSWHQESVIVDPLLKDSNKKSAKRKGANLKDANLKDANQKESNKPAQTLPIKVQHATRNDKKHVHNRLPELDSNFGRVREDVDPNDSIEECVNKLPKEQERIDRRPFRLGNIAQHKSGERERYKPKTRVNRQRNTKAPCVVSEFRKSCDSFMTRKQPGTHPQSNCDAKPNQTKDVSNMPNKPSENKGHEIRNDSGYGTAESDFEITPRLRDGKEWKMMSQSKQHQ